MSFNYAGVVKRSNTADCKSVGFRLRGFESLPLHHSVIMNDKLLKLIEDSNSILVTSHTSPDPDALCSVLLLGRTLKENYPSKSVVMNIEPELPTNLSFLKGYKDITDEPLSDKVRVIRPNLIFIVDADSFDRCTRSGTSDITDLIRKGSIKTVVIDHHEKSDTVDADVYINNKSPATTQDVYKLFFGGLELKKPDGYVDTALIGILADTNRFMYANPSHRKTFGIVSELLEAGGDIEKLENSLSRYNKEQMEAFGELARNVQAGSAYTYSYISDGFKQKWAQDGKSSSDLKAGCRIFVNGYVRNIDPNVWGVIVYPELSEGDSIYSVSLRAIDGSVDVSRIARFLGGGGHKQSAGAKIKASSVQEALNKVEEAIASVKG